MWIDWFTRRGFLYKQVKSFWPKISEVVGQISNEKKISNKKYILKKSELNVYL